MAKELWADIPGYEGEYEVSTHGRVRALKHPSIGFLSQSYVRGYARVGLRQYGKTRSFYVHTLVLTTFRGPAGIGQVCRHLDGDKTNNQPQNLTWGTHQENSDDMLLHGTRMRGTKHHKAKLTEEQARAIKHSAKSSRALAAEHGVSRSSVQDIRKGRNWGWMN